MSENNHDLKTDNSGGSGFDAARAMPAQEAVFREYNGKLRRAERSMWIMMYLLIAAFVYAYMVFNMQATTTKEWIGSGLVCVAIVVIMIQKTLLYGTGATHLVAMKEIKQLRLALVNGDIPQENTVAKPLKGIARWERILWFAGMLVVGGIAGAISGQSNRQDDVWRLQAGQQIEAHSTLTLHRFPHRLPSFYNLTGPVDGATLTSVELNGKAVEFVDNGKNYTVRMPSGLRLTSDRIELKWGFKLGDLDENPLPLQENYRAKLDALMPVHGYALSMQLEEGCGFAGKGEAWKFGKSENELRDEAAARSRLKLFFQQIKGGGPRSEFGSCGLPIEKQ